ncbi:hypothetical protein NEOLEDRAFT_1116840 [Neolentinus lepideus HHB14362 ss-1]|uniref:DUF6699 domain-containing protein n=1 Tax=Neolentinus lepideus HHB14362 ss-1 TaxID=1314782 RepID=A0A165RLX4_9AGAM|nr:hypothetical protein NEOLEDRAFT_1116840 [Neolentinus lepideus HHB14362 ss-1]
MSMEGTPFIPPLAPPPDRTPGVLLPVLPSPQGSESSLPAWAGHPQSPSNYPQFYPGLASPYGGTPYIPPGYQAQMPPGSYHPPPVGLPQIQVNGRSPAALGAPLPPHDYYAYVAAAAQAQAQAAAAAAYGVPGTPYPAHPGTGYVPFQSPLPPAGGYGLPQGPPGWGAAPVGTPYTPAWMPLSGGPPPQQAAPQPAPEAPPSHVMEDRLLPRDGSTVIARFAVGRHYGPVLTPFIARVVDARIELNPLLQPRADDSNDFLTWNMLFDSAYCQRTSEPTGRSWIKGRELPATIPRLTSVRLIVEGLPWIISVDAADDSTGVTCGEIIDKLSDFLHKAVAKSDHEKLTKEQQVKYLDAYYYNRSPSDGVPGGRLGRPMMRLDWLNDKTMFGGIEIDSGYVKQFCGDVLPCTFVVRCERRYRMTAEERREHEQLDTLIEHERPRSAARRSRSRSRSRASSATSRE